VVKKCFRKSDEKTFAVKIFRTGDPEMINTIKETFKINMSLNEHP
jgi:calcium-dependent protein kinase